MKEEKTKRERWGVEDVTKARIIWGYSGGERKMPLNNASNIFMEFLALFWSKFLFGLKETQCAKIAGSIYSN